MNIQERNKKIIDFIKKARDERGLKQKDIAEKLNKTPAAISDMERYKVQVSASELYEIAKLLDKPIEYFFGEDFGGKEIQDIIAVTRLQDNETKNSTIEIAKKIMQLNMINKKISKYKKGEDVPDELVTEFREIFRPFSKAINAMAKKYNEVDNFLDIEIETRKEKRNNKK